ncbi:cobalt-precorrin-5B (C(1))-methyltransferase CbiD [Desulfosediminicola ganghwensis]|uniref:cobalt-precorrin-5B (C(1))-methyltransferase CbiD n=1 Tax=Desulfosediminicola ganghwensis TaxID=2569540 RepID=UPI0010AC670F|nr:cobalt-precorrin-5B (C(1))-methyltransferase CbiD [Desulfosediminicola ganghwensis]
MKKKLRSGFTTGACAAAAAKGATLLLLKSGFSCQEVDIPFPEGERFRFALEQCELEDGGNDQPMKARASVIKDAGDDPDVTNGALIAATVSYSPDTSEKITLIGGEGVGTVTKPGLAVSPGLPAINPVPRQMINQAVLEGISESGVDDTLSLIVEISIPAGRELAKKTLNERLGIVDGLSILGTTGIVKPVSAKAWTDTISTSMDVAEANGVVEIVLSTGRTSEKALEKTGRFTPEALIMMGDYLEYALLAAAKHSFKRLHMAGMWAKILKAALRIPQTHVRFGALEIQNAIDCIAHLQPDRDFSYLDNSNTAREIYERLIQKGDQQVVHLVCHLARKYHEDVSGLPVTVYLVHHTGEIITIAE